jgi:hypothetical protein
MRAARQGTLSAMGRLIYGARGMHIEIEDRLLAHVQAVVFAKLRRREPFPITWLEPVREGSGRRSIWINESLELAFEFNGSRQVELDRELLEQMTQRANSTAGMNLADHAHNPKTAAKVTPVS